MKKVFSVAFIAILSLTVILYSCQKPENVKTEVINSLSTSNLGLSKEILNLDKKVSTNKKPRTLRKVVGYAVADGASAIGVFKNTVGFVGPGYAAAFGFLGGICGSLYHGWQQGDYGAIAPYNPPTGSTPDFITDLGNHSAIGIAHNKFLSEMINNSEISYSDYQSLMTTSYNYLVKRTAIVFNLNESTIKDNFTLSQYKNVGVENRISLPLNIENEVSNGGNRNILTYLNEYLIRFQNPNATFDDLILYSNYFIENANSQSNLTSAEVFNIKATISVFKNSLLYWQNVQ
jgi:hypothetical protein